MIRTTIYNALLAQLSSITSAPYSLSVPTIALGLDDAANVQKQPALFIVPTMEKSEYRRGLPLKWVLEVELYLFTKKTPAGPGVYNALPIMDAIEAILVPNYSTGGTTGGSYANDLGLTGLVYHCAIKGAAEYFGGYLDEQTIARIPIEILTA